MLKTDTRQANWRRSNPGKYDAHLAVRRSVKAGELEKESCEVCGAKVVDAHHDQYDLRWWFDGCAGPITRGSITTVKICFQSGPYRKSVIR